VIASLNGTVSSIGAGTTVVEVSGVGYLVQTTHKAAKSLAIGQKITLHTCLVVREDSFSLFGFLDSAEQTVFDLLRSVNGVGPKSALAILNDLSVDQIAEAVASDSDSTFKAVSGIGAKTAKLITLTLADKFGGSGTTSGSVLESSIAGLIGLGYSERDSRSAVARVANEGHSEGEILKLALQQLAKAKSR
jgi:Holliday junction DNA helicase RuvA